MQALWLKQAIDKSGTDLPPNETAMLTSDKILWLRCLMHDVPCIHMNKGIPTLYQREGRGVDMDSFKKKQIKDLEEKSRAVINDVKRFCRVILYYRVKIIVSGSGEIETKDHAQRKELSYFGETLVKRLENQLRLDIKEAQERDVGTSFESKKQYMKFIKERIMVSPFCRVNEAKNIVTFRAPSYKGIYPDLDDSKKIPIDIEYLYRKLKSKTDLGEEDYAKIFGDNTDISVYKRIKSEGLGPRSTSLPKSTMSGGFGDLEELSAIFSANKDVPGFIPFFCMTHLYELMYIGYAYAMALDIPTAKYKTLFDGETMEKIVAPFGKLGFNMLYEVEENSAEYDNLFIEILNIVKMAYNTGNNVCIFNVVTPDIKWFMKRIHMPPHPTIRKEVHLLALEYYQALYEAEFSLIFMNERHMKNPTDQIVHVTPIVAVSPVRVIAPPRPLTPNRQNTRKRSRSGSVSRRNSGNNSRKKSRMNGHPARLHAAHA